MNNASNQKKMTTGGSFHPTTEEDLRKLVKRLHKADMDKAPLARDMRIRPAYGQRLRILATRLGLAQQVANARLIARYIDKCVCACESEEQHDDDASSSGA